MLAIRRWRHRSLASYVALRYIAEAVPRRGAGTIVGMTATSRTSGVFEQLGLKPVINARGNNTVLGGSTPSATVRRAMLDVERYYVDMQQLLERSGQAIADMLECPAAYVTPGAAAALALGTASCGKAHKAGNDSMRAPSGVISAVGG